jgi:hypothetical protein
MPKSRLFAFFIKELREALPPTLFFAVGFNLIVLTTHLILADYLVSFGSFMVATMTALVVWQSRRDEAAHGGPLPAMGSMQGRLPSSRHLPDCSVIARLRGRGKLVE